MEQKGTKHVPIKNRAKFLKKMPAMSIRQVINKSIQDNTYPSAVDSTNG